MAAATATTHVCSAALLARANCFLLLWRDHSLDLLVLSLSNLAYLLTLLCRRERCVRAHRLHLLTRLARKRLPLLNRSF